MSEHGGPDPATLSPAETHALATTDLRGALGWLALGAAVLIGALRMDRLEAQNINPYTAPGLLPGLLGIVMMLLGGLLAARSWQRGARLRGLGGVRVDRTVAMRVATVVGLCTAFGAGLVGHGLPFWLAAAIFVSVAIVVLQAPQRAALGRGLTLRDVAVAVAVGLGAGGVITLVFQQIFLVRLP